jgi:hypothetical protein
MNYDPLRLQTPIVPLKFGYNLNDGLRALYAGDIPALDSVDDPRLVAVKDHEIL